MSPTGPAAAATARRQGPRDLFLLLEKTPSVAYKAEGYYIVLRLPQHCLLSLRQPWRRQGILILTLRQHHQVELLAMLHVQVVHCVEEVGSAGGNMREVGAYDRVGRGAEEDTCRAGHPLAHLPGVGGDAPAALVVAAGTDTLLLRASVGMAGEQEDAGHMVAEVAGDAMRLPDCKVHLAIGKEVVVVDLVEYPFVASSGPVAVLLESVSVFRKKSQVLAYNSGM